MDSLKNINPANEPERFFTVAETAEYLRCHPRTVLRWIEEGRLDAVKVGHRYLILGERILDRIKRSKVIVY